MLSLLSCLWTRQIYHMEGLYQTGHPVTNAVIRDTIKWNLYRDVHSTQDHRIPLTSQTVPIKPITATYNETVYFPEPERNSQTRRLYLLTYFLTPWSRALPDKLTSSQLVKKFSAFYGTRRFITVYKSARHLSLCWARSIQSILPHPTLLRNILILSSHLRLGSPSGLFPSGCPNKTLYTPLLSPTRATCSANLIFFDLIARIIFEEEYRSLSSS